MPLENRAQLNPKSPWFPWVLQAALTKNARGFVGCAHCRHLWQWHWIHIERGAGAEMWPEKWRNWAINGSTGVPLSHPCYFRFFMDFPFQAQTIQVLGYSPFLESPQKTSTRSDHTATDVPMAAYGSTGWDDVYAKAKVSLPRGRAKTDIPTWETAVYLLGGWPTPLKNMSLSVGIIIPNMYMSIYIYRKITNVPNHQPDINTWLWDGHKSLPPLISHYTTIQCPLNPPCFMAKKNTAGYIQLKNLTQFYHLGYIMLDPPGYLKNN